MGSPMSNSILSRRSLSIALVAVAIGGFFAWNWYSQSNDELGTAFISGNGRIEATEVDIATRLPGRIDDIFVGGGDFVQVDQVLARMQLDGLQAQRDEAEGRHQQARHAEVAAQAQVTLRESDVVAAQALVTQRETEIDAAQRRLARSQALAGKGAASAQELDDDLARVRSAEAALAATRAQVASAQAAVAAAKAQLVGAQSSITAAAASVARIDADIRDGELRSPRDGRVQFRVAQPGEVLGAGGRVLSLIDLSDVYMTFFVPETVAGRVALGADVRIVLDTAPDHAIPARVSFVASHAQFTPKTVETASERQKLMFRVRAQISPELLRKHLEQVKTGLPGEAWIKLDEDAEWPPRLARWGTD